MAPPRAKTPRSHSLMTCHEIPPNASTSGHAATPLAPIASRSSWLRGESGSSFSSCSHPPCCSICTAAGSSSLTCRSFLDLLDLRGNGILGPLLPLGILVNPRECWHRIDHSDLVRLILKCVGWLAKTLVTNLSNPRKRTVGSGSATLMSCPSVKMARLPRGATMPFSLASIVGWITCFNFSNGFKA